MTENELDRIMFEQHYDRMNSLLECAFKMKFPEITDLVIDSANGNISFTGGATKEEAEALIEEIKSYTIHSYFDKINLTTN